MLAGHRKQTAGLAGPVVEGLAGPVVEGSAKRRVGWVDGRLALQIG